MGRGHKYDSSVSAMKQPIFALIDCNNFFVSCLRVFRPDLNNKPVVALSSNDGCVVARSNEAKALGVPMGAPAFKWRQFFKENGVIQMSGNFELYGDMSRRITSLLTTITPHIEIYSVDESFLDLTELAISDYAAWGREVHKRILQWTGIPVSVGIAPSKTLAKLAAHHAKKHSGLNGAFDMTDITSAKIQAILHQTPVQDVWGIGWRLAPRLRAEGILTAYTLGQLKPRHAQQLMGIHGRQLVTELNGVSCWPLQKRAKPAKSISVTRTFGHDTNQIEVLEAALTTFTTKAAHKLRLSHQLTKRIGIFITTNKHKPGYEMSSAEAILAEPTADTGTLISAALTLLGQKYRYGKTYHRAGVWLGDFIPYNMFQVDLLDSTNVIDFTHNQRRMRAVDKLNEQYGKRTIRYASEDLGQYWQPRNEIKTPRYTTRWDELPKVKLK